MGREIELLVNPAAGGGRAGRMIGDVTRELARVGFSVNVHRTGSRTELATLSRALVHRGAPVVGVMGGDGTFHDAVNGLVGDDGALPDASRTAFAIVPAGTGGDLAGRTLGIPKGAAAVADWIAAAKPKAFDLGRLTYKRPDGADATSLFVNIASCGMSGRVDHLVAHGPPWLTGKASYFFASLRALVGWENQRVRVKVDGTLVYEGPVITVAVANGKSFGGGMIVAPEALPHDGKLDVVVLGDLTTVQSLMLSGPLYAGTHVTKKGVVTARGALVEIETDATNVLLDVDGETPGRAPATFQVLPGALSILGAP